MQSPTSNPIDLALLNKLPLKQIPTASNVQNGHFLDVNCENKHQFVCVFTFEAKEHRMNSGASKFEGDFFKDQDGKINVINTSL